MKEAVQQPTPLQGRKLLGFIPLPAKKAKQPKVVKATPVVAVPGEPTFYEQAIEWTHRADKVVNLVLGYLLAIASVLGFMDVLSNGEVLSVVPNLFYVWLAIMGLGVDFQILLVIGRVPDLARMMNGWYKLLFLGFNFAFLAFLAYMSVIIGAVFTQHRDVTNSTIMAAMTSLHIDATSFVYERAALATLLLVLMAVDRTMERWRMQVQRASQSSPENATQASLAPLQGSQQSELADALKQIAELQAQTLASMQAMTQQQPQVTIEQVTRVTAEVVKQSLEALPFNQPLQIAAPPTIHENATQASPDAFTQGYREQIERLLLINPVITADEVMQRTKCSKPTAEKWLKVLTQGA